MSPPPPPPPLVLPPREPGVCVEEYILSVYPPGVPLQSFRVFEEWFMSRFRREHGTCSAAGGDEGGRDSAESARAAKERHVAELWIRVNLYGRGEKKGDEVISGQISGQMAHSRMFPSVRSPP